MVTAFYVSIVGRKQGKFHGEGTASGQFADKIRGLAFHSEVAAPRDSATGQASGKRQYSPVTFVKEWGASSPQFLKAAVENEILNSALFEFVAVDKSGQETIYQTVKLTNATVASIKQDVKASADGQGLQDLEEISIAFQSIEMNNNDAKTGVVDNWRVEGGTPEILRGRVPA